MTQLEKPIYRSKLRRKLGTVYYGAQRKLFWLKMNNQFAHNYSKELLPFSYFSHKTILLRKLKDVDLWMQQNKITNLKLAIEQLNTITISPNEIFSYWKLIGNPTKRKGYLDGMILTNGKFIAGVGGGLCQLSNLIFWITIHTPLTVIERHRHGYDVFPDANRTQPFGSGATCFYPHGDLMIRNDTNDTYQLHLWLDDHYLNGEWLVSSPPKYSYEIVERNHEMKSEYWGGYSRNNEIYQQQFNVNVELVGETLIVKNAAVMMYPPFLSE